MQQYWPVKEPENVSYTNRCVRDKISTFCLSVRRTVLLFEQRTPQSTPDLRIKSSPGDAEQFDHVRSTPRVSSHSTVQYSTYSSNTHRHRLSSSSRCGVWSLPELLELLYRRTSLWRRYFLFRLWAETFRSHGVATSRLPIRQGLNGNSQSLTRRSSSNTRLIRPDCEDWTTSGNRPKTENTKHGT